MSYCHCHPPDNRVPKYTFALFFIGAWLLTLPSSYASDPDWVKVGDDLSVLEMSSPRGGLFRGQLLLVKTSLRRYRLEVLRARHKATVKSLATQSKAKVALNANFFDETGKPLGLVLSQGTTYKDLQLGGNLLTTVLAASPTSIQIMRRGMFSARGLTDAIQAGPRLIESGKAVTNLIDKGGPTRRSGACITASGELILFCVSSLFAGLTLAELQTMLQSPSVNCRDAINLDGGGSSQMFISPELIGASSNLKEILISGQDEVPVAIGLLERE